MVLLVWTTGAVVYAFTLRKLSEQRAKRWKDVSKTEGVELGVRVTRNERNKVNTHAVEIHIETCASV